MPSIVLNIIFPVCLPVAIGYLWGKSRIPFESRFVTRVVTYVGAPALIVSTINDTDLAWTAFAELAQWSVLMLAGFALLGWISFRILGLDFRALSLPVIFPNTGNMGLPLSLFAFGESGLASALIVFVTVSLVHFGSGDFILGESRSVGRRLVGLSREPIFLAALIALGLVITGWNLPAPLARGLNSLAGMTIPLMLITLGVSLAGIANIDWRKGWLISILRVPGGMLVCLAIVHLFSLEGTVAKVLILQGAMPSAVFNYFFALRHGTELDTVASGVVLSTLVSFATLPFLLWYLMGL